MSAWITVYCARPLGDLPPSELLAGLRGDDPCALAGVDYLTLAEDYRIDESLVENCAKTLCVEALHAGPDDWYGVGFSSMGSAPLTLHRWTQPERVAEEVSEVLEQLSLSDGVLSRRLQSSREVIGIEMARSQLADMGVVVAFEIARFLAQRGNGVVVDDSDRAMHVEAGQFLPIA
jgi:hypothetical protein